MSVGKLELAIRQAGGELLYGFLAKRDGTLVAEAGDRTRLPQQGIIGMTLHPDKVADWYERIVECEKQDVRLVPQLYSQGTVEGVVGIPEEGLLLVVFGTMPHAVCDRSPEERAKWLWQFRTRTWQTVRSVWGLTTAWE